MCMCINKQALLYVTQCDYYKLINIAGITTSTTKCYAYLCQKVSYKSKQFTALQYYWEDFCCWWQCCSIGSKVFTPAPSKV